MNISLQLKSVNPNVWHSNISSTNDVSQGRGLLFIQPMKDAGSVRRNPFKNHGVSVDPDDAQMTSQALSTSPLVKPSMFKLIQKSFNWLI